MHTAIADETEDESRRAERLGAAKLAFQEALALGGPDRSDSRSLILQALAENAVAMQRWEEAAALAAQLLSSAEACRETWQHGNALYFGHIVLGHVALARGDAASAEEELRAAGATPGSPQLNSFGPDRELAAALLRLDRRDVVRAYLEACKKFWKHHQSELDEWLASLARGELPDFADDDR